MCWTKPWNVGGIHKSNHASNYCKVLKLIFSFTITCRPDFFLLNLAWLQFGWCPWNLSGESSFENLFAPFNFDWNVEKNIVYTWSIFHQPPKSREGWSGRKLWEKTRLMQFWSDRLCTTYQRWSKFIETPWYGVRKVVKERMSTRMKAKRRNDFHQLHNKDPPTSQTKYSDYCRSSKKEFKVFIAKFVLQDQHLNLFGNLFKGLAKGGRLCLTKRGNLSIIRRIFFAHLKWCTVVFSMYMNESNIFSLS